MLSDATKDELDRMDLCTFLSKHRYIQETDYYRKSHDYCGVKLHGLVMHATINPFWIKVIQEHVNRYIDLLFRPAAHRFYDEWDVLLEPLLLGLGLYRWQIEPVREIICYKSVNENNYPKLLKYFLSEVGEDRSHLDVTTIHNLTYGSNAPTGSLTEIKAHTYDLLKPILGKLDYSKCSMKWEDRKMGDLIHMGLTHEELFETLHLKDMLVGMSKKERMDFYNEYLQRFYVDNYGQRLMFECLRVYLLDQHVLEPF